MNINLIKTHEDYYIYSKIIKNIIFENENFFIINKPVGISCHGGKKNE